MGFVGCAAVFGFVVWVFIKLISGTSYGTLANKGVPARGILLQVNWMATRVPGMSNGVRVERRDVLIDVEIPGQAPYQVRAQAYVPINLRSDVMPGATVELRVDKKDKSAIAIVGPGSGFAVTGLVTSPNPGTT